MLKCFGCVAQLVENSRSFSERLLQESSLPEADPPLVPCTGHQFPSRLSVRQFIPGSSSVGYTMLTSRRPDSFRSCPKKLRQSSENIRHDRLHSPASLTPYYCRKRHTYEGGGHSLDSLLFAGWVKSGETGKLPSKGTDTASESKSCNIAVTLSSECLVAMQHGGVSSSNYIERFLCFALGLTLLEAATNNPLGCG